MFLRNLTNTSYGVRFLGAAAGITGLIWLLLWFSGIAAGWSAEGLSTVKTNMALCQVLAGVGLMLLAPREIGDLKRRIGMVVAVVVFATGALTLSEHLFSYNLGIDQLLASEPMGAVATASPNRMGPPGSSSLMLVGAGLFFLAYERARIAAWVGVCLCVINLIPAVGFLYGITGFYSNPRLTGISWPSVMALLSVGAGLVLARPTQGPAAQLLRDDAGGILLRRVVPAVILIPLVLGYLRVQGEARGWYSAEAGTGSLVIIIVLGFLWILWRTAEALGQTAVARATAEAKLQEKEHRYRRLFDADLTGDYISTPEGRILLCNPAFARMFGFSSVEEAVGTNVADLYMDAGERKSLIERLRSEQKIERLEVWRKGRSGKPIYVVENVVGYFDERGELFEVNGYLFDDTERKRGEQALRVSEKRFATLVEQAPVGIFEADPQGQCIFVNGCWQALAGLSASEAAGQGWMEAIDPKDRERVCAEWQAAAEGQREFRSEYRFRRPDGKISWVIGSGKPIRNGSGTVVKYLGTLLDITGQKQVEGELRQERDFSRAVLETSGALVVVLDTGGRIRRFNRACAALTGYAEEEVLGRPLWFLIPPEDVAGVREEWNTLSAGNVNSWHENHWLGSDGTRRLIAWSNTVLVGANGEIEHIIGTGLDITDRRRAEEALRESETKYRSLFDSLDDGFCIIEVLFGADGRANDYRFLEVNPAFEGQSGLKGAVGKRILEMVPNQDAHWFETYGKVALTGKPKRFEARGEALERYFQVYAFRVGAPEGRRVAVLFRDETQRKLAEEAVRQKAEELRAVLDAAPVAVWIAEDRECRVITGNAYADELIMQTARGGNISRSAPPQEASVTYRVFRDEVELRPEDLPAQRATATGAPVPAFDMELVFPNGRKLNLMAGAVPLFDAQGVVRGAIVAGLDVTPLKKAQEALRESERRFRVMAEGTPLMIWVSDVNGNNQYVNRAYREFFGVEASEAEGQGWQPLVHPEDRAGYVEAISTATREHKTLLAQIRVRRHDGVWRWIEAYAEPRFSASGEFLGMAGSCPDITEQKEFQAELERLVEERTSKLHELVGELEHFSYTITHDLKSPLRAMRGYADLAGTMCAEGEQGQAREYLGRIAAAAERMDRLIADALSYSKSVRQEMALEDVDSGALLRGMLDTYPELQPGKARIRVEGQLPVVQANEAGLTQVFSNLLGNAVKFAKRGEMADIRVWAKEGKSDGSRGESRSEKPGSGRVRIWVEDKGIGIAKEMLPRVFDMFARATKDYEGTGIGLALVRKVAQRMGGKVGVESEEGKGSRFFIELKCGEGQSWPG